MEFWHTKTAAQTMKTLHTTDKGLSEKQARQTLETHGANELKHAKPKSVGRMFLEQMTDVMILVLLAAAAISACLGEAVDAAVILFIVVLNAIIGVVQQKRAEKSLNALKELSAPNAKVIRDGKELSVPAKELVPGDLVLLEAGDVVPADLRLVMSANLKVQEAALTGESLPVEKDATAVLDEKAPLGDRINMAFSSSVVTYGRGSGIVVETGMQTEVGRIAEMLMSEKTRPTPLQMKLAKLGKVLAMAAIGICIVIFAVGLLYGKPVLDMFFTAVSLAVAAIPEGLPAISTIVLAMSVQRMVKRNAIIRTLPSVEALGSATVICSDKTGTLTQNKMTVTHLFLQGKIVPATEAAQLDRQGITLLGRIAALCNDARIVQKEGGTMAVGDPTEIALMEGAKALGLCKQQEETDAPRLAEYAFDSDRKLMSTVHKDENGLVSYTKGAPDVLLGRCTKIWENGAAQALTEEKRKEILQANDKMAEQALRVLAMAYKPIDNVPQGQAELENLEQDLVFVGMTGMIDPPREEAKQAVALCKQAGIHAVMITGDHKTTAVAIAKSLGILTEGKQAITGQELDALSDEQLAERVEDIAVYARISPEHKVRIVKAWQEKGHVAAMTGDGVNDAPALKNADIGCAMGIVGTEVAKEAADIILTDDNFATVVSAVEEGRRIYDNIFKSIAFLLSSNIGEVLTLFIATMLGWAEPLLPVHLLWVNLVTDSLPALGLGVDPAENDIMQPRENRRDKLFSKGMVYRICYQGIMVGALALTAFRIGLHSGVETARTMAFAVLAISQLVHAFNVRSVKHSAFSGAVGANGKLVLATIVSLAIMLSVLLIPPFHGLFNTAVLTGKQWLCVAGLSLAPLAIVELFKLLHINGEK